MGWHNPTGHTDTGGGWDDEANAYDGTDAAPNTVTYAETNPVISPATWSEWLEFSHAAMECNKIRYYAEPNDIARVENIEIEVYYSGAYQALYTGAYSDDAWEEKAIGSTETVTGMQVRFENTHATFDGSVRLKAVQFWDTFWYASSAITGTGVIVCDSTLIKHASADISGTSVMTCFSKISNRILPRYILEAHDSDGNLVAILENAYDISYTQELNKAWRLTFKMPSDDPKREDVLRNQAIQIWLRDYRGQDVERKFIVHSWGELRR